MEHLYYLANASLTLRIVEYLYGKPQIPVDFISVIHLLDGWVVKIKMKAPLNFQQDGDFRAVLQELGSSYSAPGCVSMVLGSLEAGQSPVDVMRRYQVNVVCHGRPKLQEIEEFRQRFLTGLGYYPENLA